MPRLVVSLRASPFPSVIEASLAPATLASYRSALRHFSAYLRSVRPSALRSLDRAAFASVADLDACLAAFVQWVVDRGRPFGWAANTFWALRTFNPIVGNSLAVAHSLVTRLRRLRPSRSPPPFTLPLLHLVALDVAESSPRMAVGLLVAFDCYLRISELCGLCARDVSRAEPFRAGGRVGLVLRKTKTGGGQPQQVVLERSSVAQLLVCVVHRFRLRPSDRVFPFSPAAFRRAIARAVRRFGLPPFVAHSLRHGGASHDLLEGRDVAWVVARGRWASLSSARRYLQSARALALETASFARQTRVGRMVSLYLPKCLFQALGQDRVQ